MSDATLVRTQLQLPETIYWTVAGVMIVCFAANLAIAVFDNRTIDGSVSVWAKPLKFELSLAIHAATLALVMSVLSESVRSSTIMIVVAVTFLAACCIEMVYIIAQAARAQDSHYNVSTPFNRFMWSAMAMAAIVVIGAAGAVGVAVISGSSASLAPALKWAIVLGLIGGTLLTLYTAFTIGGRMSPYVGGVPSGNEARMALTGWSLVAGDLRVAHFLATHMIQVLPLIGLVVVQLAPGRAGVAIVVIAAALWSAFTLHEYGRALSGKSSPLAIAYSAP
ncbi:MAG: hypothetical protein AAGC96_20865 [Pseudomonadota bacterium]